MVLFKKGIFEVDKNTFEMLKRCIAKDALRDMNCVLFIHDKKALYASDGGRVVKFLISDSTMENVPKEAEGSFDLVKVGKQFKLIPSDIVNAMVHPDRVFPDCSRTYSPFKEALDIEGDPIKDSKIIYKLYNVLDAPIQYKYIEDMKFLPPVTFEYKKDPGVDLPALFNFEGGSYVIATLPKE